MTVPVEYFGYILVVREGAFHFQQTATHPISYSGSVDRVGWTAMRWWWINKSVFSLLRRLSTWRCPHLLLSAGACCTAPEAHYRSISPAAQQQTHNTPLLLSIDGQTDRDGRTPDRYIDPSWLRILCGRRQQAVFQGTDRLSRMAGGGGGSGSVVEQDVDEAPACARTWQHRTTRRRRWSLNAR